MDLIKYYTDYIDDVNEKFPTISKAEIKQILYYGFKVFAAVNMAGMDTFHRNYDYVAYVGKLFNDNLTYFHYWRIKCKKKLRYIYRRSNTIFNGKYYFGMTQKEFEFYESQKSKVGVRRKKFYFPYIYAYKIKEEAFLDRYRKYFFELDFPKDIGWVLFQEK